VIGLGLRGASESPSGRRGTLLPSHFGTVGGWWVAGDPTITLVSGKASVWPDRSGNGRDLTQGADGARPTLITNQVNGQSVLRWAGGQYMTSDAISIAGSPNTWWVVLKSSAQTGGAFAAGGGGPESLDGSGVDTLAMTGPSVLSTTQGLTGIFRSIVCIFNGASSKMRVNGSEIASGNTGAPATITTLWVGSSTSHYYSGDIAEVGFFTSLGSVIDFENFYLRRKYHTW